MVEVVEDLIKEGADVNEKDHVSLNRALSVRIERYVNAFPSGPCAHALAWRVHSAGGRPCDHLLQCASGVQGALRGRASPPAEAALVAVAPPLTARLLSIAKVT